MNRCVICDTISKSGRFYLCKKCSERWDCYNIPYKDWPEWIKALVKLEQKYIKREQKYGKEVPLDPDHISKLIESRP